MSGSAFQLLMAQGWLSVWTTLITIISVFFFTYIEHGRTQYIDWSVASFMVGLCSASGNGLAAKQIVRACVCVLRNPPMLPLCILQVFLPLLSTVWWTYQRREQALRDLAESKSTVPCLLFL